MYRWTGSNHHPAHRENPWTPRGFSWDFAGLAAHANRLQSSLALPALRTTFAGASLVALQRG
jgi:hypothetical protein